MTHSFRTAIAAVALAVIVLVAPTAGANSFKPPELQPLTPGGLWRGGVLYQNTMYAQAGATTFAKLSAVTLSQGSVILGRSMISTYACETLNKKVSPARRAIERPFKPATCALIDRKSVV